MISSFNSGVSGLKTNSQAMSVIGDNIANVNTAAFKSSSVSFANVLSQSLSGDMSNAIGSGVEMSALKPDWVQGSLETTANTTDLAISGKGFFIVKNKNEQSFYTRAGEFNFDKEGKLVNPDGMIVQGYDAENGTLGPITIPIGDTNQPQATKEFSIGMNLDQEADAGSTYSTILTVYDSLGNDIPLTITFTKQPTPDEGGSEWKISASIPDPDGDESNKAVVTEGKDLLTFNPEGGLTTVDAPEIILTLDNGAKTGQVITWSLSDDITGYASASATTTQSQDGYASGALQNISVDDVGNIIGTYSNGQSENLYQIALADFSNYSGLTKLGGNLYSVSAESGEVTIGRPGNGYLGGISSNSLEMSNVDLASEMVKMITTQRAYQANSKVITTNNEMLTELINIKR